MKFQISSYRINDMENQDSVNVITMLL